LSVSGFSQKTGIPARMHFFAGSLADGLLQLLRDHLVIALVATDRVGPGLGLLERDLGIGVERAGDNAPRAVEVDRLLVGVDDERALATTDEADVQGSLRHGLSPPWY
jgi:hypothetical protein